MIIIGVVSICALAVAGYVGYVNKDTIVQKVAWNSFKLYDCVKEYYESLQEGYKLNLIKIDNGECVVSVPNERWDGVDIYLMGVLPDSQIKQNKEEGKEAVVGAHYTLDGKEYCKLDMCNDENITKFMSHLKDASDGNLNIENIQSILSATYYDGQEMFNVTDLLQMFNITGDFYNNNTYFTFIHLIQWYYHFNLSSDGTYWRFETFCYFRHCSGYTGCSYAILFHKFVQ